MTPEAQTTLELPAETTAEPDFASRNRLVISILLVSTFVVILNETIMSVALPHLMTDLKVSASAAQWLTTAFLLTMAVVIPVTGFLIQRINTRPIFMLAMSLFSAGTLLCAISPGLELLVVGRIVQALGTAIMLPLLMTTVMTLVPEQSRGKTMGNISIVISVAPAIGPTISGFILQVLEWRWMFLLVLPVALVVLLLGSRLIKNVTTPREVPLDVISVILSALGFGGLVYGLSSFGDPTGGEGAIPGWMSLSVGAVGLVAFILRQIWLQKKDRALLDLRTLTSRTFAISVTMMAICMMALFGTIILLPIYLQTVLGLDTLQTGFLLLPGGLVMGLLAPPVGRLYDKYGPTVLLVPGAIIVSAVLWLMTLLDQNSPIPFILAGHIAISVGLALVFTPLFTASLSAVPPKLYSHGSALLGTVQQVAGATGVALFVALMSSRSAGLLAGGMPAISATAGGIRTAFLCGAIISLFAVAAAFFIRKPAGGQTPGGMPGGH
jgi:DHA2 family lincomycin resistance protein-like MFS transporter